MDKNKKGNGVIFGLGAVLCVIFGCMLVMNLTIIVKGALHPETPPAVFGYVPMVVQSGSMSIWNDADQHSAGYVEHRVFPDELADLSEEQIRGLKVGDKVWSYEEDYKVENEIVGVIDLGKDGIYYNTIRLAEDHIEVGDMIFVKAVDTDSLKVGDIIAYMDGGVVVTHRIIGVDDSAGLRQFVTKGDANLTKDAQSIPADRVVGIYRSRIAGIGNLAYFMQKPLGMLIFIGVPLAAFIIFDIIRRQRMADKTASRLEKDREENDKKTAEMQAELERLRRLVEEKTTEKPDESESSSK